MADGILCISFLFFDTCKFCENEATLWPFGFTACGTCLEDGTPCDLGFSCNRCCNEARDDLGTKCGGEKWTDGTRCSVETTCNFCENAATFWPRQFSTSCGACLEDGTLCAVGSTCNLCCKESADGMQCGGGETPGDCECRGEFPELDGALCYPTCPPGDRGEMLRGVGPLCYYDCPENFRDDGLFCFKPEPHGRGTGFTLFAGREEGCEAEHGVSNCEEGSWLIWYPKCGEGFVAFGCCICTPQCHEGFTDIGISCRKPIEKGHGAGEALPCVKAFFEDKIGCITSALDSYINLFNLESITDSFSDFAEIKEAADFGDALTRAICPIATAGSIPLAFLLSVRGCLVNAVTFTVGVTAEISDIFKGVLTYGIASDAS